MNRLNLLASVAIALSLSGCATYTYNGETFNSTADAYARQENLMQSYLLNVEPLESPLSHKRLVVGIPTSERLMDTIVGGNAASRKYVVNVFEKEYMLFYRAAKKRNIYSQIELLRTDGGDLIPADNKDLFYLKITSNNKGMQWYLSSVESGKQVAPIDLGLEEYSDKANSMINQIEAFAIKNSQ
jgi:hypothetical protein